MTKEETAIMNNAKIGDIVKVGERKYRVRENKDYHNCYGCAMFTLNGDSECWNLKCSEFERKDRKNVLFELIV